MSEYLIDRYEAFKERFGAAGVILGVIAIVLAVGGSAIAASGLNPKQKKEVKSIAKSFQGTGPAGAAGTAGTNGTNGKDGAAGTPGSPGAPGADGKTVLNGTTVPAAGLGNNGDFYIRTTTDEIYGPKAAGAWGAGTELKGEEGDPGTDGSPWTLGGTLPPSSAPGCPCTETGSWAAVAQTTDFGNAGLAAISFPIPLAAAIGASNVHFNQPETENCPGTAKEPAAKEGHLCVYQAQNTGATFGGLLDSGEPLTAGAGRAGAVLILEGAVGKSAFGTWAVTG